LTTDYCRGFRTSKTLWLLEDSRMRLSKSHGPRQGPILAAYSWGR